MKKDQSRESTPPSLPHHRLLPKRPRDVHLPAARRHFPDEPHEITVRSFEELGDDVAKLASGWLRERTKLVVKLGRRGTRGLTPKLIHDLRVACRRLRATVAFFELQGAGPAWRDLDRTARKLAKLVGPVREADVGLHWLGAAAQEDEEPLREAARVALARRWKKKRRARAKKSRSRLAKLIRRVARAEKRLVEVSGDGRDRAWLTARLEQVAAHARLAAEEATGASPGQRFTALHQARIAIKNYRYAVELSRFLLPDEERRAIIAQLQRRQERGGELQDLVDVVARIARARKARHIRGFGARRLLAFFERRRDEAAAAFLAVLSAQDLGTLAPRATGGGPESVEESTTAKPSAVRAADERLQPAGRDEAKLSSGGRKSSRARSSLPSRTSRPIAASRGRGTIS